MANKLILQKKQVKLKDLFNQYTKSNVFRSNFTFNFIKFRKQKWKFQRTYKNQEDSNIYKRYAPNLTYIPNYTKFISLSEKKENKIHINKFIQYFSYKSRLILRKRLMTFFLIRKAKLLKKFLVYRHMTTHFNIFDSNYEVLLLRLGLANSIRQAREFIKKGVLKINNHVVNQTHHLNNYDIVELSSNLIEFNVCYSKFSKFYHKYMLMKDEYNFKLIDYIKLLLYDKNNIRNKNRAYLFLGVLPFISTFNFRTFTFIYFNYLLKNQWHFYIDFFVAKKFIHYNR